MSNIGGLYSSTEKERLHLSFLYSLINQQDTSTNFLSAYLWLSQMKWLFFLCYSGSLWIHMSAWDYCGEKIMEALWIWGRVLHSQSLCALSLLTNNKGHFIFGFSDLHEWSFLLQRLHSALRSPVTSFSGLVLCRTNLTYSMTLWPDFCWVIENDFKYRFLIEGNGSSKKMYLRIP